MGRSLLVWTKLTIHIVKYISTRAGPEEIPFSKVAASQQIIIAANKSQVPRSATASLESYPDAAITHTLKMFVSPAQLTTTESLIV